MSLSTYGQIRKLRDSRLNLQQEKVQLDQGGKTMQEMALSGKDQTKARHDGVRQSQHSGS